MRSRLFYQRIKTKVQLLDSGVEPVKEQGFFQLSIPLVNSYESRHFFNNFQTNIIYQLATLSTG